MTRTTSISAAVFAMTLAFAGNAFASGEQRDLQQCKNAIEVEAPDRAAAFQFKSMRGAGLRHLTFETNSGEEKQAIVCKVKRGAVVNLDWIAS